MDLDLLHTDEIKQGYRRDSSAGVYHCALCGAQFCDSEVYPVEGRFFRARRAAELHLEQAHPGYTAVLLHLDSKYNTLTQNQTTLLELFAAGLPDKEIAGRLGVALSTVRHQKFIFREKAKQAKLYLAQYSRVFEGAGNAPDIIPVHTGAKQVDERYVTTQAEREHILATAFESLSPLRLRQFSPKEKKKVVILGRIAREFAPGRDYTEQEVNAVLREIFADFATLRRYLVEYGFLDRNKDGSRYRLR